MIGRKSGIRRKILFLLLGVGLLSFVALSAISLRGMYGIQNNAVESGNAMGEAVADYVEDFAAEKTKRQLLILADKKAKQVETELGAALENAEDLVASVERILSQPELYTPWPLPTPTEKRVEKGETYLVFSPKAGGGEITPEVSREISLIANMADDLEVLCAIYDGYEVNCYVASERGYIIGTESMPTEEMYRRIFTEEYLNEFDPRERGWYRAAKEAGEPLLTDVYVGYEGKVEITCAAPYYDGDVFAGVVGIDLHLEELSRMLSERTLGKKNISFGLNEDGVVLFSTEKEGPLAVSASLPDLRKTADESLARQAARMAAGEMDVAPVTMDGKEYYIAFAPMPKIGWSYGMMISQEEAMSGAWGARAAILEQSAGFAESLHGVYRVILWQIAALLLVLLYLMYRGGEKVTARFVDPVLALTEGVRKIAKGNFDAKLDVRTGDELEALAGAINHMTDELKSYAENIAKAAEQKKRIHTELGLAQGIQEGMLPSIAPFAGNPHFDLYATVEAAKEVGGDFYDFYLLDDERIAVTVADVPDKGVPAALVMMISKTLLKSAALSEHRGEDFGRMMERVNRQICGNNEEMTFVTVFFCVLNFRTGEFVCVNCGHLPPLLGRVRGETADWQCLSGGKKGYVLGVIEGAAYEEQRLTLSPGDMLFFYSDGVVEAMDKDRKFYTGERLKETLARVGGPGAAVKDILAAVRADVDEHAGGAEQSDDVTMLGLRFRG